MKQYHNYNIKDWNTFNLSVVAREVIVLETDSDYDNLHAILPDFPTPVLIAGGGSNLLFCDDFPGTIIKVATQGIEIVDEDADTVLLSVAAGVDWEELIDYCLERNYGGLENLTLIPGQAGSAVIQNVGAYGVEAGDLIHQAKAVSLKSGVAKIFSKQECDFGYRHSVFKSSLKGEYIIQKVVFRLSKSPTINVSYGSVSRMLEERKFVNPGIVEVASVIREVRQSKLPDTKELGSAGSFFKNPVVSAEVYAFMKAEHETMPGYDLKNGDVKLAAGWLIDQAGWKGYRRGDAGVYPQQALVLVNYGNASGIEIFQLSEEIRKDVKAKFGVTLEREVQVIGVECI